jgi:1-acyl-sn-glycerol-3-phosphate acyltransferase
MNLLRSLAFNIIFYVWTTIILIACLPLIVSARAIVKAHELWTAGVIAALRLAGIRVEFRGFEMLPEAPYILASKHQSALDTLIFHKKIDNPAAVLKRELTWIPLYGWYVRRVGTIEIDRKGKDKAVRHMFRKAMRFRDAGRVFLIFPEGTRTAPGRKVPYLPGVAGLYRQLKVPVVPVALNSGCFWPRRTFRRFPGTVVIEALPPIEPGLDRKTFMDRLTHDIETASDRLLEEARGGRIKAN